MNTNERLVRVTTVALLLLCTALAGCVSTLDVSAPSSAAGQPPMHGLKPEEPAQIKKGMTEAEVLARFQAPAQKRMASSSETDRMMPGSEWDSVLVYDCEWTPGVFIKRAVTVFIFKGSVVFWSFPYITKSQYMDMVSRINTGATRTAAQLEESWGTAANFQRSVPGGGHATYHLILPSGKFYPHGIDVLYTGPNIYSVSMKNLAD